MKSNPNLDDAYAMTSADQIQQLYARWAHSYDMGFGDAQGYQLPRFVAQAFVTAGGVGPVLDVGAGTGLVAEHLQRLNVAPIDALDLSTDMLGVAESKGLYRSLVAADVTQPLKMPHKYQGIVSAGTFTLGHVGPESLINLLDVTETGGILAISVNVEHYQSTNFEQALSRFDGKIGDVSHSDVRIYDDRADKEHRNDLARIITFRKL